MPTRMSFDLGFGGQGTSPRADEDPMRLLLIGDFSGHPAAKRPPLATRPILRVDIDGFDTLMSRLAPRLRTAAGHDIAFATLDDFHPDALFARLDLFRALRAARTQPPPTSAPDQAGAATGAEESPLAGLLGGTPAGVGSAASTSTTSATDAIDALIRGIVAPHIVPDRLAETRGYVAAVDAAIADQMRQVLHDPVFQQLEAAWRGAWWLVSNLELDESLQLHVLDVSREELLGDVVAADGKVGQTGLYQALVDRGRKQPGGKGWSVVMGLYRFGAAAADIGLLASLGLVAAQAGGPLIAEGDPALAQADVQAAQLEHWDALRASEVAPWIGLVAPRLMLRRPYGARDDRTEAFAFEELGNTPAHEHYLWGSGALACGLLLGRGYRAAEGWSFSPNDERQVDDLPSATRLDAHGEKELVPSAERFLPDSDAQRLLDAGLMPLQSHRHLNAALLGRFQSIAQPVGGLAGLPE